ncbi:hypothetical protein CSC81_07715 [Tenacibaculum discolor]|uniref:Restriction endonuclease n=1 Tax=Tenacibaculum discolor TaxID=361581 RepID=A0A2G1BW56_9FLAO|nr:restriction endonuclease [Tenacibaculum discolor]MDP2540336.1 restriction endonuclease [Tenacibaculum discolor]PHN98277.1 hypothetical protein CSC81_07715 [Tenacibaculum discolor]PHO00881.1 hypothetical protein CSC82_26505 [Rhodobacteraceae bacterium 4F10]
MKKKDFINIEILETVLDYIIEEIKNNVKNHFIYDEETDYLIELNRFEKSNIILSKYYETNFDNTNLVDVFINIVYESLRKPYYKIDDLDEFYINETIDNFGNSDESLIFNNGIFSWYEFSNWENNHKDQIKTIIQNLLFSNINSQSHHFKDIDLNVYKAIITNHELAKSLNWRNFEKLIAKILEKFEYEVELQKGTKDGGVDVIAIKKNTPFGDERYLIQAKRWNNKVGVEPVRSLIWAQNEYKVTKSCLVTTSTFTKGAWDLAHKNKWQIELKDYEKLIEWIEIASRKH